jgi:hypothetical protein
MKRLLLLPLLLSFFLIDAQTTAIPDPNFEQALIDIGLDVAPINGSVPTANIDTATSVLISNKNISDLTGIEDFTALRGLACAGNVLSSIDVSQNLVLLSLACSQNQLTSLNVSQNPLLAILICDDNQIPQLDMSSSPALFNLRCDNNFLTCLNLKNGNNPSLNIFNATNNPNLTCIEVDNVTYSTANWLAIDAQTSYSINCVNPCSTFGVGIDEPTIPSINIHPNPTTGQVTISLAKGSATAVTLRNSLGQLLLTVKSLTGNQLALDISAYPTGIYFLQLEVDGEIITKKVVKE